MYFLAWTADENNSNTYEYCAIFLNLFISTTKSEDDDEEEFWIFDIMICRI